MIGMTRSSTKRRTLSRTARSSSESRASIPKKSIISNAKENRETGKLGCDRTTREGGNTDRARLGAECRSVIDGESALVLPLMHHLVQQGVQRFVPAMASQVAPADRDLRRLARARGSGVVTESRAHAT